MHEHHPDHPGAPCRTRLADVSVTVGGRRLLERVSLELPCGELLAVTGPNGGGKTTLLRTLLGEFPHTGTIEFSRAHGARRGRPVIGYVPQRLDFDRAAPLTVADLFDTARSSWPLFLPRSRRRRTGIGAALAVTEAAHLAEARLGDLSGGELQRVLLALALTPMPDLLLLDEPAAGLDAAGMERFYGVVSRLREEIDLAILLVSHDLAAVARVADRMIFLQQSVRRAGLPAEVLASPEIRETYGFAVPLAGAGGPAA